MNQGICEIPKTLVIFFSQIPLIFFLRGGGGGGEFVKLHLLYISPLLCISVKVLYKLMGFYNNALGNA